MRAEASPALAAGWAGLGMREVAAWGLLLAVALIVRVASLGEPPLDPAEGQRALEGWTLWNEGQVTYAGGPLMPNVLSFVFGLFSAGDGQARLLSVAAGAGAVLIPCLLRPALGNLAAWSAGLTLAACPPLVVASRSASPTVLVVLFLLATAACGYRLAHEADGRWLVSGLATIVLGLAADPSFVVGAAGLALAAAIAEGDSLTRGPWWPVARASARQAVVVALVLATAVNTRLLMNPIGLQAGLVDPFWRWSADVVRGAGLAGPLLLLLIDGGVLALAAVGLAGYRRQPRAVRLLAIWLAVAVATTALMRQPDVRYLVLPLLPAGLLAGLGLSQLLETVASHGTFRSSLFGLAGLVPLITAAFHINSVLRASPAQPPWSIASIVAVAGLLVVVVLAFSVLRAAECRAALATFVLILVGLWSITTTSRLLEARGTGRAHLLEQAVLTDEIKVVREEALKWLRANPDGPIPVDPSLRPLVAWALRDVPTVRYDTAAGGVPSARLLGEPPAALGTDFRADRLVVGYRSDWATLDLAPARVWRWVIGRQDLVDARPYVILVVQPAGE